MAYADSNRRDRIVAGIAAAAVQAALIYALVSGLAFRMPDAVDEGLALFTVPPPKPPAVRTIPERQKARHPEAAAAPVANTGAQATQGASDLPGPGIGAGGVGTGFGSGGSGNGDGGGYDDETPPRWKRGRIKDSDYPREAADTGATGTVSVRYRVETDGRVTGCVIMRSSGSRVLDETTCRLIEERFRYEPSRDARGRPVISYIVRDNDWVIERVAADER